MNQENLIVELFESFNYKTYYDLGANPTAASTEMFNKLIDMGVDIYAFEPAQEAYDVLVKRFSNKIHTIQIAIGDENKELNLHNLPNRRGDSTFDKEFLMGRSDPTMYDPLPPDFSELYTTKVESVILYDYIEENNLPLPDVIKIDVENWENKIIKSIDFSKHRPIIILECHSLDSTTFMRKHLKGIYHIIKKFCTGRCGNKDAYFYLKPLGGRSSEVERLPSREEVVCNRKAPSAP